MRQLIDEYGPDKVRAAFIALHGHPALLPSAREVHQVHDYLEKNNV